MAGMSPAGPGHPSLLCSSALCFSVVLRSLPKAPRLSSLVGTQSVWSGQKPSLCLLLWQLGAFSYRGGPSDCLLGISKLAQVRALRQPQALPVHSQALPFLSFHPSRAQAPQEELCPCPSFLSPIHFSPGLILPSVKWGTKLVSGSSRPL